jgi:hypothetical protein
VDTSFICQQSLPLTSPRVSWQHKQGCGDRESHEWRQADLREMERAEVACARTPWRCCSPLVVEKLELSLSATSCRAEQLVAGVGAQCGAEAGRQVGRRWEGLR